MNKLLVCRFICVVVVLFLVLFLTPELQAAPIEGSSSGIFKNPAPGSAVVTGVGTNFFTWGIGFGTPPSSLRFTGTSVTTDFENVFSLGTLSYFNGTIFGGTEANAVDLEVTLVLTTPSGITEKFTQILRLINTLNVGTPEQNADQVFLPTSFPDTTFTIGGIKYTLTILGFGSISGGGFASIDRFNVLEGGTASAELLGRITSACVTPGGGLPIMEPITGVGSCGPVGVKTPRWGRFGAKQTLESDSQEKLEIECTNVGPDLIAFKLLYTPPGGIKVRVGICPFEGGCNSAWFFHAGDNDNNGKPDCFIRTFWRSMDYSDNDNPNLWTGETSEDKLDWAESIYSINGKNLIQQDHKFTYRIAPPIPCPSNIKPEGGLISITRVDPPFGPDPPGLPMLENTVASCDFDNDGDCDAVDLQSFQNALGTCKGDAGYNPAADHDGSGCVDSVDQYYLFDLDEDSDSIPNVGDNCPAIANLNQTDGDGDGVGDLCDNCIETANRNQVDSNSNGIGDACEVIPGDLDGDGDIDADDINIVMNLIATGGFNSNADINSDGVVNILDARQLARMCTRPNCAG